MYLRSEIKKGSGVHKNAPYKIEKYYSSKLQTTKLDDK